MVVKNYRGSSRFAKPVCRCEDWLEHWENNRGLVALFCRCCKKMGEPLVGGHVIDAAGIDKHIYIVPLCYKCNSVNNEETFTVQAVDLVSANCEYCKKK